MCSWRYWAPLCSSIGSELSLKGTLRKAYVRHFWACEKLGFSRIWGLGFIWDWSHYYMYRNGTLTFGFSSWGSGDPGTRKLVILAQTALTLAKPGHLAIWEYRASHMPKHISNRPFAECLSNSGMDQWSSPKGPNISNCTWDRPQLLLSCLFLIQHPTTLPPTIYPS